MTESTPFPNAEKSRYHHFIPQFILKNFGHKYKPSSTSQRKRKARQRIFPGDVLVKGICLTGPHVALTDTKVARTFGVQGLYADATNSSDKEHIENLLGDLEQDTSEIIAQIKSDHESGRGLIPLSRSKKDTLRKFLFIMKYRRPNVRDKYACSIEDFESPEKEHLQECMRFRGFRSPLDVWLNNIKAMLEIKMDAGCQWEEELRQKAYAPDAMQFIVHTRLFYLSFCTPSEPDDEFLMTENSYGIHEGPKSTIADPMSGKILATFYTEYHTFAHIAPDLTMILRSFLLPSPRDDWCESVKQTRKMLQEFNISMHNFPERCSSILEDLPVTKATNSYSKIVNGRLVPRRVGSTLKSDDTFYFRIFPISSDHVNKINMVLLDEAWPTSLIIFKTNRCAQRALEHYLCFDPIDCNHGLKLIFPGTDTLRVTYFKNLEDAVKLLGGNVSATYRFDDGTLEGVLTRDQDQLIDLVSKNNEVLETYYKISGKEVIDRKDFEQSRIMLKLRIKIDTWTGKLHEQFRQKVRDDLRQFYWELPPQRLWLYLKRLRFLMNGGTILGLRSDVHDYTLPAELLPGPEDVVANMREIFFPSSLPRILYFAADYHLRLSDLKFGVAWGFNYDEEGYRRLKEEKALVFGPQGSICDCGVLPIQLTAREFQGCLPEGCSLEAILKNELLDPALVEFLDHILNSKERTEMATRLAVKLFYKDLMKNDIFDVLFNIIFPVFLFTPRKQRSIIWKSEELV